MDDGVCSCSRLLLGQVRVIDYGSICKFAYIVFEIDTLCCFQIRDIVTNASRNRAQYRNSMDMALSECKKLRLPAPLIDRVRNWFIYTWEHQKTLGMLHMSFYLTRRQLLVYYTRLLRDSRRYDR